MDQPTCWHGFRVGGQRRVVRHDKITGQRQQLDPLRSLTARAVPFDWGPHAASGVGSRAAARSLARALLADALGPEMARCPECHGTGRGVGDDPEPCLCDGGVRALPVDPLVRDRIARLGDEWRITRTELLAWLFAQYPEPPRWLIRGGAVDVELPVEDAS